MIDLFKTEATDDLPEFMEITYEQAVAEWDNWLIWRSMGRRNHAGTFEPTISYLEAIQELPSEQLKVFLALDMLYGRMERQYIKQTSAAGGK